MKHSLTIIALCILTSMLSAFPRIEELQIFDPVYKQLQDDIKQYYIAVHQNKPLPPLMLYEIQVTEEDDLFSIAARCNLPYEAIATVNGITEPGTLREKGLLFIPNMPVIFSRVPPVSDLDRLILSWRGTEQARNIIIEGIDMIAYVGERFHRIERAMFLGIFFRFPILGGIVSSDYGMRNDPFTGHRAFHNGIDIAAPLSTPVIAARDGTIRAVGKDEILGLHVVIDHKNGYTTLYGHLLNAAVQLNQEVHSGMIIGAVGVSGLTTGPHLHFEVRQKGKTKDPLLLIPGEKE